MWKAEDGKEECIDFASLSPKLVLSFVGPHCRLLGFSGLEVGSVCSVSVGPLFLSSLQVH